MAIVLISRPGVVEMPEIIAEEEAEQSKANKPADECHSLSGLSNRTAK